ncbi:MAG: LysR family transcriptional regulator [Candidatus Paracaedibacteraceae bacterium]|nr:LysR family transcriptional regulator [Candidatus Paracaedibacteraceae bacterium]
MDSIDLSSRTIDLSKLRLFYEIAREGNMTKAAQRLNITQPAASKGLIALEERIQIQLFERVPNGMRLTSQGERLYIYAKKVLDDHEIFQREFLEKTEEISGEIDIIIYPYAGSEWLVPLLKDFLELNSNININIRTESENITPIYSDIAIGSFIPNKPDLIQKKLLDVYTQFYASKDYLKKFGNPQTIDDLDNHRIVTYKNNYYSPSRSTNLLTTIGRLPNSRRRTFFQIDSLHGMMNAALEGYGISELPNFPSIINSGLQLVLPEIKGENIPLHFIFQENRKKSKKIKILYNYLTRKIGL